MTRGWYADITPTRFGYSIKIADGVIEIVQRPWRLTRTGAERTAKRIIRRQTDREIRAAQTWRIKP